MLFWVEAATEDSWTSKPPIQSFPNGVAVVNGKIYTFARYETFEYDPITDVWLTKKPLPTPRVGFGIAIYESKIYVIGGWVRTDLNGVPIHSPANEVYDPFTDTWETKKPMPTPRTQLDANVVNGKIYLIGGRTGGQYTTTALNEVYDIATDSWTTKAPILNPVVQYASAVVDDKIYIIGGQNEFAHPMTLALVQIYDPATDTWSFGTPMPTAVESAAAGATTGVMAPKGIYVIGGLPYKNVDGIKINQVYNPENDSWTVGASMPTARYGLCVAVVNDMIYAMGGWTFFGGPGCSENEQYTPIGYGTVPPLISVVSPENKNYTSSDVPLTFTLNRPVVWMGYSLDGQETVTVSGNTTLSGLSSGLHNVTVYARDEFGNNEASKIITFTVEESGPFPTALVAAASGASIAVIVVGLLVYFKKRKRM
jgi:N-acetylneuraminic acid mutarotase